MTIGGPWLQVELGKGGRQGPNLLHSGKQTFPPQKKIGLIFATFNCAAGPVISRLVAATLKC